MTHFCLLTLLGSQSRFGDKSLGARLACHPLIGTAVLTVYKQFTPQHNPWYTRPGGIVGEFLPCFFLFFRRQDKRKDGEKSSKTRNKKQKNGQHDIVDSWESRVGVRIDRWFIHTSYRPGTNPPTFPSRYAFTHIIPPRRAWIGVSENDSNTPAAVCYFRVSCDLAKLRQSPGQSTPLLIALLLRLHHTPSFSEKIPRKNRENSQMLGVVRVEVYLVQVK